MDRSELKQWIERLIQEGKLYQFYKSKVWIKKKTEVLEKFHNECVWCKERGKISKAEEVHHIQFVKKHPELALDEFYTYKGKTYRNLVPLCHDCHDRAHNRMKYKKTQQFNEERW